MPWFKNKYGAIWHITNSNVAEDLRKSGDFTEIQDVETDIPEEPREDTKESLGLEGLTKPQLMKLAKEEGISVRSKDTVEILIAKIQAKGAGE